MSVVMMARYNGGTPNEVVPLVKEWKEILEKNATRSQTCNMTGFAVTPRVQGSMSSWITATWLSQAGGRAS